MSAEYEHYLVPENPSFKPTAEQLSRLLTALYGGGYVNKSETDSSKETSFGLFSPEYNTALELGCVVNLGPDEYRRFPIPCSTTDLESLGDRDYRLLWSVEDLTASQLEYPLNKVVYEQTYYNLEVHMARNYVYHLSSIIDAFERRPVCRCGQALEYVEDSLDELNEHGFGVHPVFGDTRIYRFCPSCGIPFRPQDYTIRLRDGRTGEDLGQRPGGATYLFAVLVGAGRCYDRDDRVRASDDFLQICQEAIGSPLFQIGDFPGL